MSTQHTLPDRLARLAPFESLSPREREVLAAVLREQVVAPGQIIFDVGDRAGECHVVLSGALEVFTRDDAGVATIVGAFGPGELIGEIALMDGGPRSAGCADKASCRTRPWACSCSGWLSGPSQLICRFSS